jgi:hypothetical protein
MEENRSLLVGFREQIFNEAGGISGFFNVFLSTPIIANLLYQQIMAS